MLSKPMLQIGPNSDGTVLHELDNVEALRGIGGREERMRRVDSGWNVANSAQRERC
jgi:hypothetical protein